MSEGIVKLFKTDGKFSPIKIFGTLFVIALIAWIVFMVFGAANKKTPYTVTKKMREKLEIITTDNSIPSVPVSKVPLKALGVLSRNNSRHSLKGFDIEGADGLN